MNRNDLYRGLNHIGNELLERSETTPAKKMHGYWRRWGAMAACVCLVAASAFGLHVWRSTPPVPPTPDSPVVVPPDSSDPPVALATSDTYATLEELLSYLSSNDYHAATLGADGSFTPDIEAVSQHIIEGKKLVGHQGYGYHIGQGQVVVSELGSMTSAAASGIAGEAEQLFLARDRLVLVDSFVSGGSELDEERSVRVTTYDLSNPTSPVLTDEFIQLGSMVACYVSDDKLYLMTSDGVCACGWSRLDDTDEYMPELSQNGEQIPWENHEVCILGEPTSVQYIATTIIDVASGGIVDKQAFYGDIEEAFYGPGWQAIVTQTATEKLVLHPDIYTFATGDGFDYTGKISTAALMGLEGGVRVSDGMLPDGSYPYVRSVNVKDGIYRIIGEYMTSAGGSQKTELLAITANMSTGETNWETLALDNGMRFDMDHLLWEENRTIATVSTIALEENDVRVEARLFFVEFSGLEIEMSGTDLCVDAVSGVANIYSYGSPFGKLEPIISMGDGVYLRYNNTPDGIDIFDFSDSANPRLLYDSPGEIPAEDRFEFVWEVYDESTFGIMSLSPDGQGDYRNSAFSWNIYRVDAQAKNPYILLKEIGIGSGDGFETMEYDGEHYYITMDSAAVQKMTW